MAYRGDLQFRLPLARTLRRWPRSTPTAGADTTGGRIPTPSLTVTSAPTAWPYGLTGCGSPIPSVARSSPRDGGCLIGFAHTAFDHDPTWGALLDNLHVAHGHQRRGVGSQLLALTARAVIEGGTGLYLWVLEQNLDAQAFYQARGGKRVGRALISPPGGVASRLNGSPTKLRYAWTDPTVLLGLR